MNGIDCLKAEMVKRGCTKNQIESKIVPVVLDIIANAEDKTVFTDLFDAEKRIESLKSEISDLEKELMREQSRLDGINSEIEGKLPIVKTMREKRIDGIISANEEIRKYCDHFKEWVSSCETPEGRDQIKKLQLFVDSVEIKTAYDNTAFIKGVAEILSSNSITGDIPEYGLKKVNPTEISRKDWATVL